MDTKKIIAIGLITASVLALMIKQKIGKIRTQFGSLKIIPTGLQDVKLEWNDFKPLIRFNLKLKIINPLNEPFVLNGLLAKLQRIIIYDNKGKVLGVTTPNIGNVTVPANGSYTLSKIPVALDIQTLTINLINYKSITQDSFKLEAIISVLGAEYKIK